MLKRFFARLAYGACAVAALTSCGDSKAGGTAEFATVFVTATTPAGPIDADVATWVDNTTGAPAQPCLDTSGPSLLPTTADYVIISTAYATPNTGQSNQTTASPLIITKITLTLTPANSLTPALPAMFQTQFLSSGQRITPGNNSIELRIASNELKWYLQTGLGSQSLTCANQGTVYTYRANVSFEALEINTNRVSTITPPGYLLVNFSDYID